MGVEALDVLADRGYFKGEEVLACEPLGVRPTGTRTSRTARRCAATGRRLVRRVR